MSKCGCGRKSRKYSKAIFNYGNYRFTIPKAGSECKECAKKEFLAMFEGYRKFILKDESTKKITINWDYYSQLQEDVLPMINSIMVALNVLAYDSKGNWEIVSGGMSLNPNNIGGTLYFTRKKDVIEFGRINYGTAHYHCEARKLSEIIKQEKFSC